MDNLPQHSDDYAQLEQLRRRLAAQRAINEATERSRDQAEALRIAAEERLARSEERNSKLGGMASDWTWETDAEHRLVFVSEYDRNLSETPPVIGQARWDLPDVQGLPNDWEAHRRVLDAHLPFRDFQCCGRDTTGKLCWISLNGDPVFDDCGKFSGYIGIGIDITARREAEERAGRLTRMYAALSAVNEGVVRAADELELFDATCAALHESGQFELVAIHQLDQAGLELVPMAARGLGVERLNTHRIGADGELADDQSILVQAFVQGRKWYTPDYLADHRLRAYWDRAREQGIASMLSVPLHRHGEACAVLSIASWQTHRFDDALIELADRVADGISLALDSISANRERLIAQQQLAISEERFRSLTGLSSDWHWETDLQGRISMLSESYRQNIGVDPQTRIGLEAWPADPQAYLANTYPGFVQALAERRRFLNVEFYRNDFADGRARWRALSGEPVFDTAGSFIGYRGTGRDVTDKHQVEEQLRASEERFRRLNELSSDWIWERDENLRITYLSDSYYVLTGATPGRMLGTTFEIFAPEEIEALKTALQARRPFRDLEFARVDPDGELRWRSLAGELIVDENGVFRGYRGTGKDITERKRHEAELLRQATTDMLTGLPNRTLLRDRIGQAIARAERAEGQVAVLLLDLDEFKQINDALGHEAGDEVLRAVARRLERCIRPEDTVARLGGDEFVILLEDLGDEEVAQEVASRLLEAISSATKVIDREVSTSASLGVALYPRDGHDADTLLRNADAAMYQAKRLGGDVIHFYTQELNRRAARYIALRASLNTALTRGEFELQYQPIIDCGSGQVVSAEALLRWRRGDELVSPGEFLDVAEDTDLIVPIGAWALHEACAWAQSWQTNDDRAIGVSVNLSARQFRHGDLAATVQSALVASGLDPALLTLEITEHTMMLDTEASAGTLARIQGLGVGVSIDDFGTGYSSLSYLKRFAVTELKIDRSFVQDAPSDADDLMILRAVVNLAQVLELRVVAEGVETDEQVGLIKALGCDRMQGYRLGFPAPAPEFARLLLVGPAASRAVPSRSLSSTPEFVP